MSPLFSYTPETPLCDYLTRPGFHLTRPGFHVYTFLLHRPACCFVERSTRMSPSMTTESVVYVRVDHRGEALVNESDVFVGIGGGAGDGVA